VIVGVIQMQTVEQIWQRHCRERERDHYQQIATMRSRLGTMKTQMSKLRKEMSDLEAEIRITEKNRLKEIAREKELTEQFGHSATKVITRDDCLHLLIVLNSFT